MTEVTQPTKEIKFFKLTTNEDIVAFLIGEISGEYIISKPLHIMVKNDFDAGRQILDAREWIPPIVVRTTEVSLSKELVILCLEVQESFKEEYMEAVEYLYRVEAAKKEKPKKVIPFMSIVKDPSEKPN